MTSDKTSFSLHVDGKLNKSHEVKFMIAFSKNPELPLQKLATPFLSSSPSKIETMRHSNIFLIHQMSAFLEAL